MKAKTKIKRLLGILLALSMVVGMLPTVALAEGSATETADFSADPTTALGLLNAAKTDGAEDSTWDSTTNTLTLNGVNFETTAAAAVKLPADSTIVLAEDTTNTITGGNSASEGCYGIYAEGNLTISGSGTLNVTGGNTTGTADGSRGCGIYTDQALTISGGTVKAYGGATYKASLGIYSKNNINISGTADVTAIGGTATGDGSFGINAEGEVIISGGEVKAIGGTGRGSDGIYSGISKVTINDGIVMAIGGAVTAGWSVGIFAYDAEYGSGTVTINGGTVTSAANNRASETKPFYSKVAGADIKTINFNSNGGSGKQMVAKISGETYTLPENVFTAPDDKVFKGWKVGEEIKAVGEKIDVSGSSTTVYAQWGDAEYAVTVTNGTASPTKAAADTTVTLNANKAPDGQVFDKWVAESENVTFANANSATTTFIMPADDVSVKATYATSISSVAITDIDAPVSNTALDTTAACATTGVSSTTPTVTWDTSDSKAGYYKAYTASVTLTAAAGYTFADGVAATINGNTATSVTKHADGTLTVTYAFPKTEKHNIEITFDTAVSDGDTATNPTISSGYEFEFCFFCEDTDKDGVFIDETTGSAVIDDKTLVVDKALVEEFAEQSEGRFTYESLMAALKSEFGLDELKTEFTGGYDYSVFAYIDHSDGAYFDYDEDGKVTNAIIKVNNEDITDNCQVYSSLICIMPGTYVFNASSAATYTVTFDANGGSVTPASAVTGADGKLTSLPTPTRSHHSFNGWYTEASGGTKVDTNTIFTADTTIYAHWTYTGATTAAGTTRYTVSFETNGGSKVSSKTVTRNTAVSEPTAPTKDGYTFDGWYSDKALKTAYDFSAKVTKSFTLYAKWTEKATEPDKPTDPVEPTAPEWKNPFTDVKKSDWFYTNVEYAVNNKLMNGTTATTFAPSENLTRAMLIAILYRAEGEPAVNKSIPFSDVAVNAYYANAVIWAQQNGIVNGVTENEFAPDDNITREQIAAIMFRFAKYKGYDVSVGESTNILSYTDARDVSEYTVSAMQYAVGSGLMNGKTESTINPLDNATRAEIAAILQRFIEANK